MAEVKQFCSDTTAGEGRLADCLSDQIAESETRDIADGEQGVLLLDTGAPASMQWCRTPVSSSVRAQAERVSACSFPGSCRSSDSTA